jgi:hypothetical protein
VPGEHSSSSPDLCLVASLPPGFYFFALLGIVGFSCVSRIDDIVLEGVIIKPWPQFLDTFLALRIP